MSGWRRYLELQVRSRTGLTSGVVVCAVIALLAALATFIFATVSLFIWLAEQYSSLTAALILSVAFLLITIIALVACILVQRHTVQQAKLALTAASNVPWLDPRTMAVGLQIGRAIGWRRLVPLVAVGVLAAEFARGWLGREKADDDTPEAEEQA